MVRKILKVLQLCALYITTVVCATTQATTSTIEYITVTPQKNCSLSVKDKTIIADIQTELTAGASMMKYQFIIRGRQVIPDVVVGKNESKMFKPLNWVKTIKKVGTKVLLLKPNYHILSFTTLSIETRHFNNIDLEESPANCLDILTYTEIEELLRKLTMNNLRGTKTGSATETANTDTVCNQHIRELGVADFSYYCCSQDKNRIESCEYLVPDFWFNFMTISCKIVIMFALLFGPLFIPSRLYFKHFMELPFVYDLEKKLRIAVELIHQAKVTSETQQNTFDIRLPKVRTMPNFKVCLKDLYPNSKKEYEVDTAVLLVEDRLVIAGNPPVGAFTFFYDFIEQIRLIFHENLKYKYGKKRLKLTNFQCARHLMRVFVIVFVVGLMAIRTVIYYLYEEDYITLRKEAAAEKGYTMRYFWDPILNLSPIHPLVIASLTIFSVGVLILSAKSESTKAIQVLLRICVRDNLAENKSKIAMILGKWLFSPFQLWLKKSYVKSILMAIIVVPVALLHSGFYSLPSLNLLVRLMVQFISYIRTSVDGQETERIITTDNGAGFQQRNDGQIELSFAGFWTDVTGITNKRALTSVIQLLLQLFMIVLCLFTLFAGLLILFEISTMILNILLYTFIGAILYANYTWRYFTLAVLVIVYARDCFGGVPKRFRDFSSTVTSYIWKYEDDKAPRELFGEVTNQRSRAIAINPCELFMKYEKADQCPRCINEGKQEIKVCPCGHGDWTHEDQLFVGPDGKLIWKLQRVALFVDKDDTMYLPDKFFFNACRMNYGKSPGRLHERYLRAIINFLGSLSFLGIVLLVVLTFVEWDEISATNQVLATLLGGITPLLLTSFFLKQTTDESITPSEDVNFRVAIHKILATYEDAWLVHDLKLNECNPELDSQAMVHIRIAYQDGDINQCDFHDLHKVSETVV